jgi:hypothetical protein
MALRSSWFIVTETELFIGRFRATSRLPQYLMTAMFDGAECVAEIALVAMLLAVNSIKNGFPAWEVEPPATGGPLAPRDSEARSPLPVPCHAQQWATLLSLLNEDPHHPTLAARRFFV